MKRQCRSAFTLVELLVVIAIIGILIALLLPAVQAAREAARRTQCVNQLSQLILAVQNYELAHEVYPAGVLGGKGPVLNQPQGYNIGWLARILPYIEQDNTFRHLDFSVGAYAAKNRAVRKLTIRTFNCPSDPAVSWARSSYAGCHHDLEAPIDTDNNGVLLLNRFVPYNGISDGSSQTIFLGEKLTLQDDNDLGWLSGTRSTLRNTGNPINTGRGSPPAGPAAWLEDQVDAPAGTAIGATTSAGSDAGAQVATPDDAADQPGPAGGGSAAAGLTAVGGFGSHHPGGANFAFGDGSVQFISESISMPVYQQLGHRSDGKLLDESQL